MEHIIGFCIGIIIFGILLCLVAILTNYQGWKYYKRIYTTLPNQTWYNNNGLIYNKNIFSPEIVWFVNTNEFKLREHIYLHNFFITYLDPYSFYWLIKYQNWFKRNVDVINIPKFRPYFS